VQVDIIKQFLRTQPKLIHSFALQHKLCSLTNQEFSNQMQLLSIKLLVSISNISWFVSNAGNFEQLLKVSDVL
jgi:hypothetical protein